MTNEDAVRGMVASYVCLAIKSGAFAFRDVVPDAQLEQFASDFDFLMAVYADESAPTGFCLLPIKGWDIWKSVAEGKLNRDVRANAVPCVNRESAIALLNKFGDPSWLNDFEPLAKRTMN